MGHDGEQCPHNPVPADLLLVTQFSPSNSQRSQPSLPLSNLVLNEFSDDDEDPDDPLMAEGQMPSKYDCDPSDGQDYEGEGDSGPGLDDLDGEIGLGPSAAPPDSSRKNGRARSCANLPAHDCLGNHILTFVHSNGIHGLGVRFCQCPDSHSDDRHLHLLDAGFYPATQTNPSTVFTLSGLDYVLIDNLECKTVLNAYSKKLRRLSDENDPGTVPVFLSILIILYSCQLTFKYALESLR